MPFIVVKFKGEETHRFELTGPITIGRDLACEVWIGDPRLSRAHCKIHLDDQGRWTVTDLESRNGIYLRELRVSRFVPRDGEAFCIGDARITFHKGSLPVERPRTPQQAVHESLMTPVSAPVTDRAAPPQAAKRVRVARRSPASPRPPLESEGDAPLVRPFGLAFQRPAPSPRLALPSSADDAAGPIDTPPRNWFASLLQSLRSLIPRDRDAA